MSKPVTLAIDNGTSGSIGVLLENTAIFMATPNREELHYSKAGKFIKRIDFKELKLALAPFKQNSFCYIERPFTAGPAFINTMLLSQRAYEATLLALEDLGIGTKTIDSKEWQSTQLPGVKGSAELKKASKLRGIQLYPQLKAYIEAHGDADGLLIARHYHHRN